jgi:hypothetical protein
VQVVEAVPGRQAAKGGEGLVEGVQGLRQLHPDLMRGDLLEGGVVGAGALDEGIDHQTGEVRVVPLHRPERSQVVAPDGGGGPLVGRRDESGTPEHPDVARIVGRLGGDDVVHGIIHGAPLWVLYPLPSCSQPPSRRAIPRLLTR